MKYFISHQNFTEILEKKVVKLNLKDEFDLSVIFNELFNTLSKNLIIKLTEEREKIILEMDSKYSSTIVKISNWINKLTDSEIYALHKKNTVTGNFEEMSLVNIAKRVKSMQGEIIFLNDSIKILLRLSKK